MVDSRCEIPFFLRDLSSTISLEIQKLIIDSLSDGIHYEINNYSLFFLKLLSPIYKYNVLSLAGSTATANAVELKSLD